MKPSLSRYNNSRDCHSNVTISWEVSDRVLLTFGHLFALATSLAGKMDKSEENEEAINRRVSKHTE